MNTRNAPLSPVSIGGSSEWSGPSKYQADGLYPNNRGLVSPPDSGSPSGTMNGFPGGPRSVGGPSPPPSVGRSSTYARSESGRSIREENTEPVLGEHYVALRRYLASTSKDGRANPPPNKARDKLLRLSEAHTGVVASVTPRRSTPGAPPGAPPSRTGTPVNGMGLPRGPNGAMRRPSDASSIRSAGPPRVPNDYPVPPSPIMPSGGNFDRPLPKQFQSNTIVPNKSTMVEEDDDGSGSNDGDSDAVGPRSRNSKERISSPTSEVDKKLINDYQKQVQELRGRIEGMETEMKKKDEELVTLQDGERSRATASNLEKKEWNEARTNLEGKLADAETRNVSLRDDLERLRDEHAAENRALREEIEEAHQSSRNVGDSETTRENEELRMALQEQQHVTEEARREARQFLEEMRALSQQHMPSWEKQTELERKVEQLEKEVRDWRNRYARTKTQLRNMRASSIGLTIEANVGNYIRDKGFAEVNGLVKDVHVTKFQISIDELLRRARTDEPERVIDGMKSVIVNVRRITKDIEDSQPEDEEVVRQQQKLKNRVSATANNLITASKNFASAADPATPAAELEDDDDGSVTPVESAGYFSNRTTATQPDAYPQAAESPLAPPPSFQGLRAGTRDSANSSAYSPYNSPRESLNAGRSPALTNGQLNGNGNTSYNGLNKGLPASPNGYGGQDAQLEDLKIYLEDQTALMVQTIQGLVGSIRGDAPIQQINQEITSIAEVVGKVVAETEASGNAGEMVERLSACRQRLLEAGAHGKTLAARGLGENDREWRMWTQTLPPIAFELVRETKELVQRIDRLLSPAGEDFS
ncbi:hypothetical protein CIB48_g2696 [Xylaria polymorpha]|nr:hypothetical protein CIB48_g2696 [Xylaria polymorpha]